MRLGFVLVILGIAVGGCAPDPCVARCPNDMVRTPNQVEQCRATWAVIDSPVLNSLGACAAEVRSFRRCINLNLVCDSSGRSAVGAGTCMLEVSAVQTCCAANAGRASPCSFLGI